jgi:hypothetical protein
MMNYKPRHASVDKPELRDWAIDQQEKHPNSLTAEFAQYATLAGVEFLARMESGMEAQRL